MILRQAVQLKLCVCFLFSCLKSMKAVWQLISCLRLQLQRMNESRAFVRGFLRNITLALGFKFMAVMISQERLIGTINSQS